MFSGIFGRWSRVDVFDGNVWLMRTIALDYLSLADDNFIIATLFLVCSCVFLIFYLFINRFEAIP